VRQLTGGNSDVTDMVDKLDELVKIECQMMSAETMTGMTRIKAFSIRIQDLTMKLGESVSKLRSDTTDLTFRLDVVQQSQGRIEENTIDIKKAQNQQVTMLSQQGAMISQQGAKLDEFFQRLATSGSGKQQNESQETKTSVSEEFKRWKKLGSALEVEGAMDLNKAFYERIRSDRVKGTTDWILEDAAVKNWIQGETSFVVVNGDTGNGKTFIASRLVEHLIRNKPSVGSPERAVAYFFCRKGLGERSSVVLALKTMAYDVALSDKLFANNLSGLIKDHTLQSARPAPTIESVSDKLDTIIARYDSIVGSPDANINPVPNQVSGATFENDEDQRSDTGSHPFSEIENAAQVISDMESGTEAAGILRESSPNTVVGDEVEPSEPQGTPSEKDTDTNNTTETDGDLRLRRVSTAVLQDTRLGDDDEEGTVWGIQRHWEKLFVQFPKNFEKHVYLVIDGLDECDETEVIALCAAIDASAGAVAGRAASKTHVLLLMNAERAAVYESHALTAASIVHITPTTVVRDIDQFVRERISSAWENKLVTSELRAVCRKAVVENCNSNFLKASLLVNEVTSFLREDIIRDAIAELPKTAKTIQSATLLVIKRLASQLNSYDREDFHVSRRSLYKLMTTVIADVQ
jgi:hypothetical protein